MEEINILKRRLAEISADMKRNWDDMKKGLSDLGFDVDAILSELLK